MERYSASEQETEAIGREMAQRLAVMVQEQEAAFDFTVEEVVMMGRQARKRLLETDSREDRALVGEILAHTGLASLREQGFSTLSGGEKQRVLIARALAQQTAVLVLDEPTAGLDPAGRENLMANIRDYHRNKKRTIILVSHSMDEIARNVDRILVLKSAHVLMSGTPAEVFARAEELLSAGLDVPQVTRIAMRLREQGLAIDPAVYTVEALERELLALRRGETGC